VRTFVFENPSEPVRERLCRTIITGLGAVTVCKQSHQLILGPPGMNVGRSWGSGPRSWGTNHRPAAPTRNPHPRRRTPAL